ncbi:MAG: M20/M25/M40 family metallo-hydrolase [Gemmatimonadales bacterium]|jgi:hypothetical protein|nr:M20/M25/M40 family metallo-hydrolase [Gemmatimonadales bacterium]
MRRIGITFLALAWANAAPAQTASRPSKAATAAVATITAGDVARRVGIIAHDSMGGRDTPSRGLDLTAQYVADEFRRFGLEPAGDSGTFLQHYGMSRWQVDPTKSQVMLTAGGTTVTAPFGRAARYAMGAVPAGPATGPVVVVGGKPEITSVAAGDYTNRVVLVVLPSGQVLSREVQAAIAAQRPAAIVPVSTLDSASFAQRAAQVRPRVVTDGDAPRPLTVEVQEQAIAPALSAAGVDLASVRASTGSVVREVAGSRAAVTVTETLLERRTAPNTVGILRGSDPALAGEYVVFSAHMDHVGHSRDGRCAAMGADSICNGADDDASGTVGVVELAEAFARKGVRPKRSMIFLAVSGEEGGLRGSRYFTEKPPVPIGQMVANINMDMIGRNWPDTIVAIGREHSDLGATLDRVQAAHPELGMAVIDDIWPQENFYRRSDHFNFARKGVPILFFFNGVHDDYHRPSDHPDKIDADKEARIVRMVFWLGLEIANAAQRPKWNEASYRDIVAVR